MLDLCFLESAWRSILPFKLPEPEPARECLDELFFLEDLGDLGDFGDFVDGFEEGDKGGKIQVLFIAE